MRQKLVFEVTVMKCQLKEVCERLKINFSSAKNVIQIYKKEGRLAKKVVKARKPGTGRKNNKDDSAGSGMEDEYDEDGAAGEEGNGVNNLAP